MSRLPQGAPLEYGREVAHVTLGSGQFTGATSKSYFQPLKASAALVSIWAESNAGVLTVRIYSVTDNCSDGQSREVLVKTATITGPTTDLQIYRVDDIAGGGVRVEVESTNAADILLKIKAAHSTSDTNIEMEINDSALVVENPIISNQILGAANTEATVTLPANTKKFQIKARGNSRLQFSYVSGQTGTTYWTEFPGFTLEENNVDRASTTIYVRASKANEVLEIKSWS